MFSSMLAFRLGQNQVKTQKQYNRDPSTAIECAASVNTCQTMVRWYITCTPTCRCTLRAAASPHISNRQVSIIEDIPRVPADRVLDISIV